MVTYDYRDMKPGPAIVKLGVSARPSGSLLKDKSLFDTQSHAEGPYEAPNEHLQCDVQPQRCTDRDFIIDGVVLMSEDRQGE